ncbi:hypothetical protein AB0K34_11110 [Actinomadura sp. NPDC049382]|uniref:hypothetical protein n=1 Tax=Actinomadura sp. NPDC049382 TaxID=3158220 RepID=UPI0034384440
MPKATPRKKYENATMSYEELLALPTAFDVVTAGRGFGIGESKSRDLARRGEFPCRILRVGREYRVTRADLFRALGIEMAPAPLSESA